MVDSGKFTPMICSDARPVDMKALARGMRPLMCAVLCAQIAGSPHRALAGAARCRMGWQRRHSGLAAFDKAGFRDGLPLRRLRGGRCHPLMYPWLLNSLVPDYYAALGLERTAPPEAIRTAYRRLILELHPDKMGEGVCAHDHRQDQPKSTARFIAVRDAWEVRA